MLKELIFKQHQNDIKPDNRIYWIEDLVMSGSSYPNYC